MVFFHSQTRCHLIKYTKEAKINVCHKDYLRASLAMLLMKNNFVFFSEFMYLTFQIKFNSKLISENKPGSAVSQFQLPFGTNLRRI